MALNKLRELMPFIQAMVGMSNAALENQQLEHRVRNMSNPESPENQLLNARVRSENATAEGNEFQNANRDELLRAKLEELDLSGLGSMLAGFGSIMPEVNKEGQVTYDPGREAAMALLHRKKLIQPRKERTAEERLADYGFDNETRKKFLQSKKNN